MSLEDILKSKNWCKIKESKELEIENKEPDIYEKKVLIKNLKYLENKLVSKNLKVIINQTINRINENEI